MSFQTFAVAAHDWNERFAPVHGVVEIPVGPPCLADVAEPFGTLNFFDVSSFISLHNAGDPSADFAAPFGTLNFFDVSEFISAYNAGCP